MSGNKKTTGSTVFIWLPVMNNNKYRSDMKKKVIKIMLGWIEHNEPIETTADKLLDLFNVSGQSKNEDKKKKIKLPLPTPPPSRIIKW